MYQLNNPLYIINQFVLKVAENKTNKQIII